MYRGSVQAGVGIFFQQESDGNVYIKTIVSGGSAERDGTCRVGDMIVCKSAEAACLGPVLMLADARVAVAPRTLLTLHSVSRKARPLVTSQVTLTLSCAPHAH